MKMIYLDYAAATPMAPAVQAAMQPYFDQAFYNPSATYLAAQQVSRDLDTARAGIAHWFGSRPAEIVFTAGGTEANNLAIQGVMEGYPGANVVVSAIEHEAVLAPAGRFERQITPVDEKGIVELEGLEKLINDKTVLVSIMYANNEVGTIQPLSKIASLLGSIRRKRQRAGNKLPLYFHSDACQAANYLDLHASRLGVDLMTINAGKIYGPKQCGALYVRGGVELQSQILGGGQERGLRSGTENVGSIIGFAVALALVQSQRHPESERLSALRQLFIDLLAKKVPGAIINGSMKQRLPNNVHITIPGTDNERLMMQLDEQGIQCAVGSACSASNDEPSHVLKAMGFRDEEAQSSLRFTLGQATTAQDVKRTVQTMVACLRA